ncbi:hypothetical protein ACH5RR_005295 [Cinchona calisaya]|uniref:Uncharacterized protein n=1 Tax=Cinchona calisaya TaxID=153742 RepID=A0ABD3AKT1_9GENT
MMAWDPQGNRSRRDKHNIHVVEVVAVGGTGIRMVEMLTNRDRLFEELAEEHIRGAYDMMSWDPQGNRSRRDKHNIHVVEVVAVCGTGIHMVEMLTSVVDEMDIVVVLVGRMLLAFRDGLLLLSDHCQIFRMILKDIEDVYQNYKVHTYNAKNHKAHYKSHTGSKTEVPRASMDGPDAAHESNFLAIGCRLGANQSHNLCTCRTAPQRNLGKHCKRGRFGEWFVDCGLLESMSAGA